MMSFDPGLLLHGQYHDWLLSGLRLSLLLAGVSLLCALPLGAVIAVLRMSPLAPLRALGAAYVEAMRNVPLLAHLLFWYFGAPGLLPEALRQWLYAGPIEFISAAIGLSLYSAAYMAEDIRSGLRTVRSGQFEAARALGFGYLAAMRLVVLPQALQPMLPSLLNQFIATIKATSLGYIIGLTEVSFIAAQINTQDFTRSAEVYLLLSASYFVLCFGLSRIAHALERRLGRRTSQSRQAARAQSPQVLAA